MGHIPTHAPTQSKMSQFRKVTTFRRNQKSRNRPTNSGRMPQSNSRRVVPHRIQGHHEPNGVRPQCSPDCPRQRTKIEIEPRRIQGHFAEDFMVMPTDQGCVAQIPYSPRAPPIVLAQSQCHSEQNQRQSLSALFFPKSPHIEPNARPCEMQCHGTMN